MSLYLDTSAAIKLIFAEKESQALRKAINGDLITSTLTQLELLRTIDRLSSKDNLEIATQTAHAKLKGFALINLDSSVITFASSFQGLPYLKSLDAIHLASAMLVKSEITTFITYDKQLARAATTMGFDVAAPV